MTNRRCTGILALLLSTACGDRVPSDPVPECQAYEATLSSCFHRPPSGFATQASLIPKTKADRERIAQTCSANLARLKTACR